MAVPKQRQSPARTRKRRAQHRLEPPRLRACPRCGERGLPHRVCANCGHYAGREVVVEDESTE